MKLDENEEENEKRNKNVKSTRKPFWPCLNSGVEKDAFVMIVENTNGHYTFADIDHLVLNNADKS